MFTFNEKLILTSLSTDFINTHTLPSIEVLQNTPIITMFAFIATPKTESDHTALHEIEARIRAIRFSDTLTYNLLIANQLYEVSCKVISNYERTGTLKRLEKPQLLSNKNKSVDDQLTSFILSRSFTIKDSVNTAMPSNSDPSIIKCPESKPTIETNKGNLPRILVVDDSEVNRDVVDIFLDLDFPTPIHTKNGLEVLDILQREQLDIILMDIHMPEMNGVDAALAIRKIDAPWSNIPIIALTADTSYQHTCVYKKIGMDDAISKPIRQEVLIKTILRNWNASKLRREAQSANLDYAS